MGWRSTSREVLQMNDPEKLTKLLTEYKSELIKQGSTWKKGDKKQVSRTRLIKKDIARIRTRLSQLRSLQ